MPDGAPQDDLRREVGRVKELVGELREEINQLKEQEAAGVAASLGLDSPHTRRQALGYLGGGAAVAALLGYGAIDSAQADAVAADVGTQADPWQKVWTHELESGDGATELQVTDTILPDADGTRDLGASGTAWANLFSDAVTTDDVDIGGSITSTKNLLDVTGATDALTLKAKETTGVSTSATTILSMGIRGGPVWVVGEQDGAAGTNFVDEVLWNRNASPVTVDSSTSNAPAGRTYSGSGSDLQLAMASDTYDVVAVGWQMNPPGN